MNVPIESAWRGLAQKSFDALDSDVEVDVAIVGGGVTGLLAAYSLKERGKKIVVLESDTVGNAATGLTTAFLVETIDTEPSQLIRIFGETKAEEIIASHRQAIDRYEQIVQTENIQCDFMRCPLYLYASSTRDRELLRTEADLLKRFGTDVEYSETSTHIPLLRFGYIKVSQQAKFHPLKFLNALSEIVTAGDVQLFEHTTVLSVEATHEHVLVRTEQGTVKAGQILIATHYPFGKPLRLYFKKAKYISYVAEAEIEKGVLPEGLYVDTQNPYHYFRVDRHVESDRVIVGGEDHRADIQIGSEKSFEALEEYVHNVFPDRPFRLIRKWKGPIIEPGDGLAYIGTLGSERIFYATGYSGNGMTYAAIAAEMFTDHVLGRSSVWSRIYSPDRPLKPHVAKAKDYLIEFIFGAVKNFLQK